MAKDNSFDVVSEVDMQEVDNAFQQTPKELVQRYDLKDSGATIEFSKADKTFTLHAPSDFVAKQVIDVLNTKLIRRQIDLKAVTWGQPGGRTAAPCGSSARIVMGIETDLASKINKDIRTRSSSARSRSRATSCASPLRCATCSRPSSHSSRSRTTASRSSSRTTGRPRDQRSPSVAFITLGCPKNEVDTDRMRAAVLGSSYYAGRRSRRGRRPRGQHVLVHRGGDRGVHRDHSRTHTDDCRGARPTAKSSSPAACRRATERSSPRLLPRSRPSCPSPRRARCSRSWSASPGSPQSELMPRRRAPSTAATAYLQISDGCHRSLRVLHDSRDPRSVRKPPS